MPNIAALITVAAVMFAVLGAITLIAHIYKLNNSRAKRSVTVSMARLGGQTKRISVACINGYVVFFVSIFIHPKSQGLLYRQQDIGSRVFFQEVFPPRGNCVLRVPKKLYSFLGRGGATEQMSFCRSTAKRIVRSFRRRSDRCHLS